MICVNCFEAKQKEEAEEEDGKEEEKEQDEEQDEEQDDEQQEEQEEENSKEETGAKNKATKKKAVTKKKTANKKAANEKSKEEARKKAVEEKKATEAKKKVKKAAQQRRANNTDIDESTKASDVTVLVKKFKELESDSTGTEKKRVAGEELKSIFSRLYAYYFPLSDLPPSFSPLSSSSASSSSPPTSSSSSSSSSSSPSSSSLSSSSSPFFEAKQTQIFEFVKAASKPTLLAELGCYTKIYLEAGEYPIKGEFVKWVDLIRDDFKEAIELGMVLDIADTDDYCFVMNSTDPLS